MEHNSNKIKCPNCGKDIDVNEILYHQLDEKLKKEYNAKLAEQNKEFKDKFEGLKQEKQKLDEEKERLQESIESGIKVKLKTEKSIIEKQLRHQIEDEKSEEIKSIQEELNQKSEQLKEYNKAKAEIEKLKREKGELKEQIEAESEVKYSKKLQEERDKIKKLEEDKSQLKISEKEQLIEQLKNQLSDAQRKADQGSIQMQGEVQELALEEWLKANFPLDTIEEIKKGARGADCLHIINTRTRRNCGSIYYESKRTKDFQQTWIEKFKIDMRIKGANIGVLVTEAMPKDMERMGQRDGIWICSFSEFKGLCYVLRESLIQISNAVSFQENKGDKMSILYDYLTSNEFKLQIEAIVEGFTQMHVDLDKEKRAMEGIWKRRQKQIQKVLLNTNYLYNSIKGIAGSEMGTIKSLELPEPEEEAKEK